MITIQVQTARPYFVHIGTGLLKEAGGIIKGVSTAARVLLVMDDVVAPKIGASLVQVLADAGFIVFQYTLPHGEDSKNIRFLSDILETAAQHQLTRQDLFIACGGGVVGDITGFAASAYMRGVAYIQIPTTLLAAVDASVGGKTAIDLAYGKNLAGAFWQPSAVICDTDVIRELPLSIFNDGMAEVIKHGLLRDKAILDCIEQHQERIQLEWLIGRNIEIKADVVAEDEREIGSRKLLNAGHTIAHAIEKASDYSISHGKAVAIGLVYEAELANQLGLCCDGFGKMIKQYCQRFNLYQQIPITTKHIGIMALDKKNSANNIAFVLPCKIGQYAIIELTADELGKYIKRMCCNE